MHVRTVVQLHIQYTLYKVLQPNVIAYHQYSFRPPTYTVTSETALNQPKLLSSVRKHALYQQIAWQVINEGKFWDITGKQTCFFLPQIDTFMGVKKNKALLKPTDAWQVIAHLGR